MKIIDVHTHVGNILGGDSDSFLARLSKKLSYANVYLGRINHLFCRQMKSSMEKLAGEADEDKLLKAMKQTGISHSVIVALEPYVQTDDIVDSASANKGFIPFMSVHPGDPDKLSKMKKFQTRGCRGIKLHPVIQNFLPSEKSAYEIYEEAQSLGLPVLFHTGFFPCKNKFQALIEHFEGIPLDFPRLRIIVGHMNMFEPEKAISFCRKFENVFLETSKQPARNVRKAINKVGANRVLFGSDWPFGSQEISLRIVDKAVKGNSGILEKILYSNSEDLLSLCN